MQSVNIDQITQASFRDTVGQHIPQKIHLTSKEEMRRELTSALSVEEKQSEKAPICVSELYNTKIGLALQY